MQPHQDAFAAPDAAEHEREVRVPVGRLERMEVELAHRRGQRQSGGQTGGHHSGGGSRVPTTTNRFRATGGGYGRRVRARALWFVAPRRVEVRPVEPGRAGGGEDVGTLRVRTIVSGISGGTELLAYRGLID